MYTKSVAIRQRYCNLFIRFLVEGRDRERERENFRGSATSRYNRRKYDIHFYYLLLYDTNTFVERDADRSSFNLFHYLVEIVWRRSSDTIWNHNAL